jgi:hypothetical protein
MGKRLTRAYLKALDVALATLGDVGSATGRAYRTLQAYRRGEAHVPPGVARALADYLRRRAVVFTREADVLERQARKEEER